MQYYDIGYIQFASSIEDCALKSVQSDKSLIEAGTFLEEIAKDDKKVACLETFAECQEFVRWLQKFTAGIPIEDSDNHNKPPAFSLIINLFQCLTAMSKGL